MSTVPFAILEEISDRLRRALMVSEAAETADPLQDGAQSQALVALCEEAISLERVSAMLRVMGALEAGSRAKAKTP
jgi:hypothetical protein